MRLLSERWDVPKASRLEPGFCKFGMPEAIIVGNRAHIRSTFVLYFIQASYFSLLAIAHGTGIGTTQSNV